MQINTVKLGKLALEINQHKRARTIKILFLNGIVLSKII